MKSVIKALNMCILAATLSSSTCSNNGDNPVEPSTTSICEPGLVTRFTEIQTDYKWDVEQVNATKTSFKTDIRFDYESDGKNNIAVLRKTYSTDSKYAGLIETIRFEYDQDGFVKSRKTSLANYSRIDNYRTSDATYEYSNGLLVKTSGNYVDYNSAGIKETIPFYNTYEYDMAGRLTKSTDKFNRFTAYAYDAAGKLIRYFWGENNVVKSDDFSERNFENGYTSRMYDFQNQSEYIYKYDALGQRIEYEFNLKNKFQGLARYAYDDKKLPVFFDNPMASTVAGLFKFKGHFNEPPVFGRQINNLTSWAYLTAGSKFDLREFADLTYNSDGYPVRMDLVKDVVYKEIPETTFARTFEYCK